MGNVAIMTDSNSGITQSQAKDYGVAVIPMPFIINGVQYHEDIDLSQEEFFQKLSEDAEISTSQPAVGDVIELWDSLLSEFDSVVYIPMSSGLSSSCQTASALAEDYDGKVQVVNNQRISVPLRQSVLDAKTLADAGWDAQQIKEYLERVKFESIIYIMVDTLTYLKRGGRITSAAAALGTLLSIKPVLQIQGEKLDSFAKAYGVNQAREVMIDALRRDFANRYAGYSDPEHMWLHIAYTYDKKLALDFKREVEESLPGYEITMDPLSLSVSCHIGPGALGIGCSKKLDCL